MFLEKSIRFTTLPAVNCDEKVFNTGYKNGIKRQVEISIKRPLQWFVYFLQTNELSLSHILRNFEKKSIRAIE